MSAISNLPVLTTRQDLRTIFHVELHKTTLNRLEAQGKWPKRLRLSHRSVAWRTSEIIAHLGVDPSVVMAAWAAAGAVIAKATA